MSNFKVQFALEVSADSPEEAAAKAMDDLRRGAPGPAEVWTLDDNWERIPGATSVLVGSFVLPVRAEPRLEMEVSDQ